MEDDKILGDEYTYEQKIELRTRIREYKQQGKQYREICNILNIDKRTFNKITYLFKTNEERFESKLKEFKNRNKKYPKQDFTTQDVMNKFGPNPICYITKLKLTYEDASLDHIIPASRGGSNELDNLGLTWGFANFMKYDTSIERLIRSCKLVLEGQGYKVEKI